MENQKSHTIDELNEMFKRGEECDRELFAEMKSNILLVAGKHFNKKITNFHRRIFSDQELSKEQKIRLTRNHIQKIQDQQLNGLMSFVPDVHIGPANQKELKDIKAADMHNAVWRFYEKRHKLRQKKRSWGKRYLDLGEVFVKVFWDQNKGKLLRETPQFDEFGQVVGTDKLMEGDLILEEHLAFNVLRDSAADTIDESPFLCIRKLLPTKSLIRQIGGKESDLMKYVAPASQGNEDVYRVFDATTGEYRELKDHSLLLEWYFRPCEQYPTGYWIYSTKLGKLFEGELPDGVFPIKYAGYKEVETSARSISHIRNIRPHQVEINRAASKVAEHQITVGDDKLIIAGNAKVSFGQALPGVRSINVLGPKPDILPGRTGDQYVPYIDSIITEMYNISPFKEWESENGQIDPYAMLFSSAKERLKFSMYAEKFEDFYVEVVETALRLIKLYAPEELVIKNTGTGDYINMQEFKSAEDLCYQVKVDKQSGDIESRFGQQIVLNQLIQYAGDKLSREDFGMIARNMPLLHKEEILSDLTCEYDSVVNDILELDRGGVVRVNKYDNHEYIIKKLINRMKKPDFRFLPPEVQNNYELLVQEHENVLAMNVQELKRQQAEFIPMDGPQAKVDMYDQNGKRMTMPLGALVWLEKQLQSQGLQMDRLQQMNPVAATDTVAMTNAGNATEYPYPQNAPVGGIPPEGQTVP